MFEATDLWTARSAWDAVAPRFGRSGKPDGEAGVVLRPMDHRAMATILVRRTETEAFRRFAVERWDLAVPDTGRAEFGHPGGLVWSAPSQWLAVGEIAADPDELATALTGIAAVTAQGDGRAMIEIGGPCARDALAKLLSIDLHPDVFAEGCTAVAAFAHLSVQLWQCGSSDLTLCVPRTVAGSVWRALVAAAAPFGCETIDPS